jgi:hypothetical protein
LQTVYQCIHAHSKHSHTLSHAPSTCTHSPLVASTSAAGHGSYLGQPNTQHITCTQSHTACSPKLSSKSPDCASARVRQPHTTARTNYARFRRHSPLGVIVLAIAVGHAKHPAQHLRAHTASKHTKLSTRTRTGASTLRKRPHATTAQAHHTGMHHSSPSLHPPLGAPL